MALEFNPAVVAATNDNQETADFSVVPLRLVDTEGRDIKY
jgi:hypothetical protein